MYVNIDTSNIIDKNHEIIQYGWHFADVYIYSSGRAEVDFFKIATLSVNS